MDLFILRHGDAARTAQTDQERCLTGRGRQELHETLAPCREELTVVTHMLVSPYVRAQQTSEIAAQYLPTAVVAQSTELLVPEANPLQLMDFLQQWQQQNQSLQPQSLQGQSLQHQSSPAAVMLVSHQPLIGTFLNTLCGLEVGQYPMGTGALAAVQVDLLAAGLGHLRWLRQTADGF